MNRAEILYLFPYLGSLLLSAGVLFYAWRHRSARGVRAYTWYALGQTLWIFGFIIELVSTDLSNKIFWDGFQWLAGLFILIAFPVFAVQYSNFKLKHPRRTFWLSLIIPATFALLLMTDSLHHWIYPNSSITTTPFFPELVYDFTPVVYAYAIYSYLIILWGMALIVRCLFQTHGLYRAQLAVIILGFLTPIAGTVLSLANVQFAPQRDGTPFTAALGNLIVAWGLIRFRIFEIIPVAREHVMENMLDLVFVLDSHDFIVDANPAALFALNQKPAQVIGRHAQEVFAAWSDIIEKFNEIENINTEIKIDAYGRTFHFEVKSTILEDNQQRYMGRIFVARDITDRVRLQTDLQKLNEELEMRVLERTEELRTSAERYRVVVENQSEFIVRWKSNGIRTYVNDAYCKYYGITREQALSSSFLELVAEEDRPAVQEKIDRLTSGAVNVETEVHRVVKPDGSIGWQEWTDQAVRDETGQIIEFQSVGKDITERKKAELALRESEKKHRLLFESANDSIFIMKEDRFIDCNSKTLEMFGCRREQILGKSPVDFSPNLQPDGQSSNDKAREKIEAVLKGKSQFFEWKHCRLDKTLFDAEVSLNQLELDDEIFIQAIVRDITERKRTEETILKQLAFEELMTTILTSFAICPHDEIDASIQEALKKLAAFMEIERAYIIIINPEHRDTWSATHEWRAPQLSSPIVVRQKVPFGTFSWAENQILAGNITKINTLDDYPPEAFEDHQLHQAEGAQSILNVPIRGSEGPVSGCIGGQTYSHSHTWSDDDVNHLKIVGDAIASLLERKHAEEMVLKAYDTTLEGWAKALELRDKETEDHSRRVTELTVALAISMGLQGEALTHIRRGAILHDIGKMAIPDEILRKRGPLTDSERKVVEQHPLRGFELLAPISFLEKAMEIPYCHHERWDGTGYPRGLKGEEIPLSARIFSVIDVWDALLSDRPYSKAWPKEKTIRYLKDHAGKHFDPGIVEVFLGQIDQGEI